MTLDTTLKLDVIHCPECNIRFYVDDDVSVNWLYHETEVSCPNGHQWEYKPSVRVELERTIAERDNALSELARVKQANEAMELKLQETKPKRRRTRKAVQNG